MTETEDLRREVAELRGAVDALSALVVALLAKDTHTTVIQPQPFPMGPPFVPGTLKPPEPFIYSPNTCAT